MLTATACTFSAEGIAPPGLGLDENPDLTNQSDGASTSSPTEADGGPGTTRSGTAPGAGTTGEAFTETTPDQVPYETPTGEKGGDDGVPRETQTEDPSGTATGCPAASTFALRADMEVEWPRTHPDSGFLGRLGLPGIDAVGFFDQALEAITLVRSGTGLLSVVVLLEVERDADGTARAKLRPCEAVVPPFEVGAPLNERYGVTFPNSIWDSARMPQLDLGPVSFCTDRGCELQLDPLDAVLGISLPSPDAPWPASGNTLSEDSFPDHDADEAPGITAVPLGNADRDRDGTPFSNPPTEFSLSPQDRLRARHIMMGFRVHTQITATFEDCGELRGESAGSALNAKVGACTSNSDREASNNVSERKCSREEVELVDRNLPEWRVTSTTWTGKAVPDGASCEMARQAVR